MPAPRQIYASSATRRRRRWGRSQRRLTAPLLAVAVCLALAGAEILRNLA